MVKDNDSEETNDTPAAYFSNSTKEQNSNSQDFSFFCQDYNSKQVFIQETALKH